MLAMSRLLHDQTFLGWFTTGGYVAAAFLCACAAQACVAGRRAQFSESRKLAFFWGLITTGLVLLAINKQMDLQTVFTDIMRNKAEDGGWYRHRRVLQALFVLAAGAFAVGGLWMLVRLLGPRWREHHLLLAGLAVLCGYLMLRVADIERVGEMTGMSMAAEGFRSAVEWAGLAMIAIAAWRRAVRV
jgi:hypothetical protein